MRSSMLPSCRSYAFYSLITRPFFSSNLGRTSLSWWSILEKTLVAPPTALFLSSFENLETTKDHLTSVVLKPEFLAFFHWTQFVPHCLHPKAICLLDLKNTFTFFFPFGRSETEISFSTNLTFKCLFKLCSTVRSMCHAFHSPLSNWKMFILIIKKFCSSVKRLLCPSTMPSPPPTLQPPQPTPPSSIYLLFLHHHHLSLLLCSANKCNAKQLLPPSVLPLNPQL